MIVKIALAHKSLTAMYAINQVDDITYNASLQSFDGPEQPPTFIKFYKTELGWRSAFEDDDLIRELGEAVTAHVAQ